MWLLTAEDAEPREVSGGGVVAETKGAGVETSYAVPVPELVAAFVFTFLVGCARVFDVDRDG